MIWKRSGLVASLLAAAFAQPVFAQQTATSSGITSQRRTHAENVEHVRGHMAQCRALGPILPGDTHRIALDGRKILE